MINKGPKGQYVQKGPAQWVITLKSDRPKGKKILKILNNTKQLLDDEYRPEGPICSNRTGPKGHYA
jgi:hypothetical protein